MINYAPATPRGKDGLPKYDTYGPAKVAITALNKENAAVSSILLLNNQTTELEITPTATTALTLNLNHLDDMMAHSLHILP